MSHPMPNTPPTLLTRLRDMEAGASWESSWKVFLELYQEPLRIMAWNCYQHHTGGANPSGEFVADAVATVVSEFHTKAQYRYDPTRGKLRRFLKMLTNARVVDLLRAERPLDHTELNSESWEGTVAECEAEGQAFQRAVLATLVEDLRNRIPVRQFEVFEMVKLQGISPEETAAVLGVKRGVVDNTIYRAMNALRELASDPVYREEYYP